MVSIFFILACFASQSRSKLSASGYPCKGWRSSSSTPALEWGFSKKTACILRNSDISCLKRNDLCQTFKLIYPNLRW
jgi:hypothetical protein